MDEVLTMSEIETRFDGEWVLLGEPMLAEDSSLRSGRVLWHSRDRDEVYEAMIRLSPRAVATLYVGDLPDDMAIVL